MTVTATLSEALTKAVTIPLKFIGAHRYSAYPPEAGDYEAPAGIRILAGATTGTGTIRTNHDDDGDDELFTVALGALPPDVKAGSPSSVEIEIQDDYVNAGSTVTLSATRTRVKEGEAVELILRFSRPVPMPERLQNDIMVRVAGIDNEDGDTEEYLNMIRVDGGRRTVTFSVQTYRDTDGDNERFTVSIPADEQFGWMTWLTVGSPSSVEIEIEDEPVLVTLSAQRTEVPEGGDDVEMTLNFSAPVPLQWWEETRIPIRVSGTDIEAGDLRWLNLGLNNISVRGGERSRMFLVGAKHDSDADDERFTVSVDTDSLPEGLTAGSPSSVEMVIVDNTPYLTVQDVEASESGGNMHFRVKLHRPPDRTVVVHYEVQDVTATHGLDYRLTDSTAASVGSTRGHLVFEPGRGGTERRVTVSVIDDAVDEGDETFRFILSNPSGAVIKRGQATGTIRNDDPLQSMWLSRFGRTVGSQVTDAVSDRLLSTPGAHATLAGQGVDLTRPGGGEAAGRTPAGRWPTR